MITLIYDLLKENFKTGNWGVTEDVTKGRLMFPSFRTSYIKENTWKGEETNDFNTNDTHMRPCTQMGAPSAHGFVLGHLPYESRRLAPGCHSHAPGAAS